MKKTLKFSAVGFTALALLLSGCSSADNNKNQTVYLMTAVLM